MELLLNGLERAEGIALVGPLHGKFRARYQIIDMRQHAIESVIDGVDIHRDWNPMLARDPGGTRNGTGIMRVDVEQARTGDLLHRHTVRMETQAIIALPEYGPLSRGLVNQDIGGLVRTVLADFDIVQVDAALAQAFELDAAAFVITHGPDILHPKPQFGASYKGAGYLSPRAQQLALESDFAGVSREVREKNEGVSGVLTHTDNIKLRQLPG